MAGISEDVENLRVNRADFMLALDEVHPAFGVSEEELQQVVQNGIIHFDPVVDVRHRVHPSIHLLTSSIGDPPVRRALRRASTDVNPNTPRQHHFAWACRNGQNCTSGDHCASIGLPVYQIALTG